MSMRDWLIMRRGAPALLALGAFLLQGSATGGEFSLDRDWSGRPVPQYHNGFFAGFELDSFANSLPVYLYDSRGQKVFDGQLKLDEQARRVAPRSIAVSKEGVVAVAGSAFAGQSAANFIAWLGKDGQLIRVVRMNNFAPLQLCFTHDGTLWAAGRYSPPQRHDPEHDVLRAFDRQGRLKFSLLPRSSFAAGDAHPVRVARLACNGSHVALLSVTHREMVIVSASGQILSRNSFDWPVQDPYVTGFVTGSSGEVAVSLRHFEKGKRAPSYSLFAWLPAEGRWSPIRLPEQEGSRPSFQAVFAWEGNQMLVSAGAGKFQWQPSDKIAWSTSQLVH